MPLSVAGREVAEESMTDSQVARWDEALITVPTACLLALLYSYSNYTGYKPISLYSTLAVARLGRVERGL